MEFINQIVDAYMANVDLYFPVLLSIFVLGVATGFALWTNDEQMRMAILAGTGLILLGLAYWFEAAFEQEYYLNLSTEMFGVLAMLLLALFVRLSEDWMMPLGVTLICATILLFLLDRNDIGNTFPLVMSTELIGAYVALVMLRREWLWSKEAREDKLLKAMRGKPGSTKTRRAAADAETRVDFYTIIPGRDVAAVQERLAFLEAHQLRVVESSPVEQDEKTGDFYQQAGLQIKTVVVDDVSEMMANHEARIRILAYPDTAKRVYAQLSEVLDIDTTRRMDGPKDLFHGEVIVQSPKQLFSEYLEAEIFKLVRDWRTSGDPQKEDAIEPLLEWANAMKFIK
jgi:hypothetical protein